MSTNLNLAARAGRWSVHHRRRAILGWLAFVVLAVAIGTAAGTRQLGLAESNVGEAGRADAILRDAGFSQPARERVLLSSPAAARDLRTRLAHVRDVENVRGPVRIGEHALVTFDIRGKIDDAPARVGPAISAVEAVRRAHPGVRIDHAGDASLQHAIDERIGKDFVRAEFSAVPITLLILALAFGAVVAALVPVLLGLSAVAAALGLLALPSQVWPIHEITYTVVLLVGLAVGVDYALFFLRRAREERAAGRASEAAVLAASATAGRAVLVSGATVIVAMAGMLISDNPWYRSYALGIVVVVGVAMLASVTVLPAVAGVAGGRGRARPDPAAALVGRHACGRRGAMAPADLRAGSDRAPARAGRSRARHEAGRAGPRRPSGGHAGPPGGGTHPGWHPARDRGRAGRWGRAAGRRGP
jgi:RND superfamily putative drug exporter